MASSRLPPPRPAPLRAVLALLLGVAVIVTVTALWMGRRIWNPDTLGMPPLAEVSHPAAPAAPADPPTPSFDIVRVGPDGNAVMAGRAAPGAEVIVHQGDKEVGRTRADAGGDWVLVPAVPLAPGAGELTLSEQTEKGKTIQGQRSVVLVVPRQASPQQAAAGSAPPTAPKPIQPALALLAAGAQPPRILQGPPTEPGSRRLQLGTLDYGNSGQVRFAGTAAPGSTVRVYVDGHAAGDAKADAAGNWSLTPSQDIAGGQHRLRLDQLSGQGQVTARVDLPFTRTVLTARQLSPGSIVVQPGDNLWLIARQSYGHGIRYTVIFQANHGQIRDPNLIYPGQVFTIPSARDASQEAMPNSSSTSR